MSCPAKTSGVPSSVSKKVAIIGAGAAGLASTRELLREGHDVTVFEKSNNIGGLWVLDNLDAKLQTLNVLNPEKLETAASIHGSLYEGLRTNIPRQTMGFSDFPLNDEFPGSTDSRMFCEHREVLKYLQVFAKLFNLNRVIQLNSIVTKVDLKQRYPDQWDVEVLRDNETKVHLFDAVVVATGNNTVPHVSSVPGIEKFGNLCIHSHTYRKPKPFAGKNVAILGNNGSGSDLAVAIGDVSENVFLCGRTWTHEIDFDAGRGVNEKFTRCRSIEECSGKGKLKLTDGRVLENIDVLIFCTGYIPKYPFLESSGLVSTQDRVVYPLYRQVFHAKHPTLAFVGIPIHTAAFILAEYQSKWVARVFSESCQLPANAVMLGEVDKSIEDYKTEHGSLEHFHVTVYTETEYMNTIAKLCGDVKPVGSWRQILQLYAWKIRATRIEYYRDVPLEHETLAEAAEEFSEVPHAVKNKT